MRFTQEVNIFAKGFTLKRFQTLETDFKVQQGKISSLISESELLELQNGDKTMYSRMASTEQTVSGLEQQYTDVTSKYDAVSRQYTDLDSKVGTYKQAVDGFSADLSQLSTKIRDDYSTTSSMQAYVNATVRGLETRVSNTYITTGDAQKYAEEKASGALSDAKGYADAKAEVIIEDASEDAQTKANAALDAAKADTAEKLQKYSTTAQMNSAISQKANEITASVEKTYATIEQFDSYEKRMLESTKAQITQNSDSITAWVEQSTFNNLCANGDFSDGTHYWTDVSGYVDSKVKIITDQTYGKAASIAYGGRIGQSIEAGSSRVTISFMAKTITGTGAQVKVSVSNNGSQAFDLEYDKWKKYSVTVDITDPDVTHIISFETSSNLSYTCVTGISFLETATDYMSARIQILSDRISSKVEKNGLISEINQSSEKIQINAAKIQLEGLITANQTFQIDTNGSMTATAGKIGSWSIKSGSIQSGDESISMYGGTNPYIQIGHAKLAADSHAATIKYGLWVYAGTNTDFSDGSDELRFYNLQATSGNTLGIAKDKHVGTIASSSKRYKIPNGATTTEDAYKLLDIPVVQFMYKEGYLYKNDDLYNKTIPGFYAEEVEEIIPKAVIHDEEGRAEDWNYRILFPLAVKLLQDMDTRIKELESR